jgi:hypothetical protein
MRTVATLRSAAPAALTDYNQLEFEDFARHRGFRFHLVTHCDELDRKIAHEAVDLNAPATGEGGET